jgi:hypothetical protein
MKYQVLSSCYSRGIVLAKGKTMKNFGYIIAGPSEFLIHQRFGKIRRQGREIGFLCLPFIDSYYRIPSSTHGLNFTADQITAENQGVEVSGFAIWKVCEPERACRNFDFSESGTAIRAICTSLKDVVESAIRHQVANMSIEDVLRKRGSIILKLKQELAYIADQWGLNIETIEIKNVSIMSEQLFANMQAKFRDSVRLESETSALETDRLIAERRFVQREQLALREQEFKCREMEREAEMDALALRTQMETEATKALEEKNLEIRRLAFTLETKEAENANRQREIALEENLHAAQRVAQKEFFALETERAEHEATKDRRRNELDLARIENTNRKDPLITAIETLPTALAGLNLNTLNLGQDALQRLADGLATLTSKQNT